MGACGWRAGVRFDSKSGDWSGGASGSASKRFSVQIREECRASSRCLAHLVDGDSKAYSYFRAAAAAIAFSIPSRVLSTFLAPAR
jgi:hypothetical protein